MPPPRSPAAEAEVEAPLPGWVTSALGAAPPELAPVPPAPVPGFPGEPDGDTTVERAVVRGYLPPPVAAPEGPVTEPRRGGRTLAVVAALVAVAALALAGFVVLTKDDDTPTADRGPDPTGSTPSTTMAIPTGLTAVESPAGVQLDWDGADDDTYAVLMMSETAEPQVLPVDAGASMLVPATSLDANDGYCFAVAYLRSLEAAAPDTEEAFGPPVCIRGASEDTVRPG